jgi:hypothetical protein
MKQKIILTIITCLIGICTAVAQIGSGKYGVKGYLVDSASGKPVEFVTVSLENADDKTIKTQHSKTDGAS